MTELITIKTFNDRLINDGSNYEAKDFGGAFTTQNAAKPTWIPQDKADQTYSGTYTVDTRTLTIGIKILGADKNALAAQLRFWLKRGTYGNLVATFSDDSTDYLIPCVVTSLISKPSDTFSGDYVVSLQTSTTSWKAVTASTDTWSYVPTTGETKTISVGGTDTTKLIAAITPTGNPAAGYLYHANYLLKNVAARNFGYYPHCMTVNTGALIAASQMLESCYDLAVYLNGVSVPRWIIGANAATTKVWFNVQLNNGFVLIPYAGTDITAGQAVTSINLQAKQNYIGKYPPRGIILIDSELFTYSAVQVYKYYPGVWYKFTITGRAAYGSTAASHLKTATVSYVQNAIQLMYGCSTATDPAAGDDDYDYNKPLFDLTNSDNTKWVYSSSTGFFDLVRPGTWSNTTSGITATNNLSGHYDYYQAGSPGANPVMGMKLSSFKTGTTWNALSNALVAWSLYHAAGIYKVTVDGFKWRNLTNWVGTLNLPKPPALAGLQYSADGLTWINKFSEATPASASTWTAITNNTAQTVSSLYARLILAVGAVSLPVPTAAVAATGHGVENLLEITSATVEFISASLPVPVPTTITTTHTVTDHMHLAGTLTNAANTNAIKFDYPMLKNKTFTFDSETATALYQGGNAYNSIRINDLSRDTWVNLTGGSNNVLSIDSASMGDCTVALSWYKRRV